METAIAVKTAIAAKQYRLEDQLSELLVKAVAQDGYEEVRDRQHQGNQEPGREFGKCFMVDEVVLFLTND